MQHALRLDRPVTAYPRWIAKIPGTYRKADISTGTSCSVFVL